MKISVLTPSFNSSGFIERAILSVLHQDYANVEHIIADAGSDDGTVEILKKYGHLVWISEKDKGQSDAMNKAFKISTGDIIVYLNADDYFEPNVFGKIVKYFNENNCDIVVGNLYNRYFNNDKEILTKPEYTLKKILYPQRYHFPYNPVSYFYRRHIQEKVGEFPIEEHYAMDYWFLLRAFNKQNKVEKLEIPFGTFYRTGMNKTSVHKSDNRIMIRSFLLEKGLLVYISYLVHNFYFNVWHALKHQMWKRPFKYIYYLLFVRNRFESYKDFERHGYKNYKTINKNVNS